MKGRYLLALIFAFLVVHGTIGQESNADRVKKGYSPDYVKVQFAGNIGLLSAGVGYNVFNDFMATELLYGYVPESVSEAEKIHVLTLKNTIPVYSKTWDEIRASLITGFTFTYETGNNSELKFPDRFPDGYYFTNAFHVTLFGGVNVHKKFEKSRKFKGIDFYIEWGAVETYLWYAITSKEVKLKDAFSTALGINLHL